MRSYWILIALVLITPSAFAEKALMEDFNAATLSPGFTFNEDGGAVTPNANDNETWTIDALTAWDWGLPKHSIISPVFTGTSFTIEYSFRNVEKVSQSQWDVLKITLQGLASDLVFYLGSSSDNGEIKPDYALYYEIQNPDKNNYYIWDSTAFGGGNPVPEPWVNYVDRFPDVMEVRIEFNGPSQPVDVYYNFDGLGWTHLLPYGATSGHTFTQTVGAGSGQYQVFMQVGAGSTPPLTADADYLYIHGDIESEYATGSSSAGGWSLYR
ncbi:MAG: hypothetical protein GC154_15670 [bacterium]|nr:hypothetical protein [bacterium]